MKWVGSDVTVVITTIPGREDLYDRAVASVANQRTLPRRVVAQLDQDRRGAYWARNEAVTRVDTEWTAFLDDDDELLPNHITKMLAGANFSGADLVYTYAEFVGGRDPLAVMYNGVLVPEPINVPWDAAAERSLREHGNFIPVTNMVRTSVLRAVGGFPAPNSFDATASRDCEDYGLLLRLLDHGSTFYHVVGVRTWRYHFWGGNVGGRGVGERSV